MDNPVATAIEQMLISKEVTKDSPRAAERKFIADAIKRNRYSPVALENDATGFKRAFNLGLDRALEIIRVAEQTEAIEILSERTKRNG